MWGVVVMPVANRLILSCGYPRLSAAKCWAICVVCCLALWFCGCESKYD